ncbi:MAG: hypothetical protein A2096_02095 [Spirochaetes bacterium GWF1_41_5]|nr:MAG: hypothetical protein A2096_02095 [Spirochaetes bacterium GWF1_41_5]
MKIVPSFAAVYYLPARYDKKEKKSYGSHMVSPKIEYLPGSSVKLALGADLYHAWKKAKGRNTIVLDSDEIRFGRLHKESRVYIECSYTWGISK